MDAFAKVGNQLFQVLAFALQHIVHRGDLGPARYHHVARLLEDVEPHVFAGVGRYGSKQDGADADVPWGARGGRL